jgi:Gas vesicle protein G
MGLLRELALLPLAPVRGVVWVAEQVQAEAERRLYDPGEIRRQLDEWMFALDAGEIDEAEYAAGEAELLDRLAAARGITTGASDG